MCSVWDAGFERFFLLITCPLCLLSHFHHRCSLPLSLLFVLFTGLSAWARCPTSSTAKATSFCQAAKGACFPESQDHTGPALFSWHHCTYCRSVLLYVICCIVFTLTLIKIPIFLGFFSLLYKSNGIELRAVRIETLFVHLSQVFEAEPPQLVALCVGALRCAWGRGCWW